MTLVVDKFRSLIPPRAKSSPSGWTSFNAPCCSHRGHNSDKRKRGGLRFDNGIIFNCFNCKFTASWQPGRTLSEKFKNLCKWMGASDTDINEMIFEALKTENTEFEFQEYVERITFEEKPLPEHAMSLMDWSDLLEGEIEEKLGPQFIEILRYLMHRGYENPFEYDFYWSPTSGYIDRVIIPFRWQGKIVGNTARKIIDGKPKYLSDQHSHFVFNCDEQKEDQKYILVCEGPFDALSVNGVALLTNDIADQQARILNNLGSEIIVIPDQDRAGLALIDRAIHYNFSVAFPNWDPDVKDVAEAVQRYGRLFVVTDAIMTAQKGEIKIKMAKKNLEKNIND